MSNFHTGWYSLFYRFPMSSGRYRSSIPRYHRSPPAFTPSRHWYRSYLHHYFSRSPPSFFRIFRRLHGHAHALVTGQLRYATAACHQVRLAASSPVCIFLHESFATCRMSPRVWLPAYHAAVSLINRQSSSPVGHASSLVINCIPSIPSVAASSSRLVGYFNTGSSFSHRYRHSIVRSV